MIITLVGILTEPQWVEQSEQQSITYIFEPSLLATDDGRSLFNNIPVEGRRLLQHKFPIWEPNTLIGENNTPDYWQLAQQFETLDADSIVVFVNAFAKALKGKRPTIATNVNWVLVQKEKTTTKWHTARKRGDSLEIKKIVSDAQSLKFETKRLHKSNFEFTISLDSVTFNTNSGRVQLPYKEAKPLSIKVVYDRQYRSSSPYLKAAFAAIEQYYERELLLTIEPYSDTTAYAKEDAIICFTKEQAPVTNGKLLIYKEDDLALHIIENSEQVGAYRLTQYPTAKTVQDGQFVLAMAQWLFDEELHAQDITRHDYRVASLSQLQTKTSKGASKQLAMSSIALSNALWMLLLIFMLCERVLSKIRKQ